MKVSERTKTLSAWKEANPDRKESPKLIKLLSKLGVRQHNWAPSSPLEEDRYELVACGVDTLSPEDCLEISALHEFINNRNFDLKWATELSVELSSGDLAFAIFPDGTIRCVNGHHTLWGAYLGGHTLPVAVKIYYCKSETGFAKLFSIFDSCKKRNLRDAIRVQAMAGAIPEGLNAGRYPEYISAALAARSQYIRSAVSRSLNAKARTASSPDLIEFARFMDNIRDRADYDDSIVIGVLSSFYSIWYSNKSSKDKLKTAEDFIYGYLSGVDLDNDSPIYLLRKKLIINRDKYQHGPSAIGLHVRLVRRAWEAWNDGVTMTRLTEVSELPDFDSWGCKQEELQTA